MIENKKASILLVLKVLEKFSDEEHFLLNKTLSIRYMNYMELS